MIATKHAISSGTRSGPTQPSNGCHAGDRSAAFICRPQSERFVDSRRQRWIVTRRQSACQGLIRVIDNRLFEVHQYGHIITLEKGERRGEHPMLERWLTGAAERAAQREVAVQHPWRARPLGLAVDAADAYCRQTCGFEHVGERTHGARAEWSNRRQQDDIDTIVEQQLRCRRPCVESQGGQVVVRLRTHESDVSTSNRTDHTLCSELDKSVDRIHHVEVDRHTRTVEVRRRVSECQIASGAVEHNESLAFRPRPDSVWTEAGGRDDCDTSTGENRRRRARSCTEIEHLHAVDVAADYFVAAHRRPPGRVAACRSILGPYTGPFEGPAIASQSRQAGCAERRRRRAAMVSHTMSVGSPV